MFDFNTRRHLRRGMYSSSPVTNFVLVETPQPEKLWFPFVAHKNRAGYPANWSKASYVLRRSVGFRCELCGSSRGVSVHHKGAPFADGRPGDPLDKHDLRRENLQVLCCEHHRAADHEQAVARWQAWKRGAL